MIDWDLLVLTPLIDAVFGESITYVPGANGPGYALTGVFDAGYREIDAASTTGITDAAPVCGFHQDNLTAAGMLVTPAQGDTLTRILTGYQYVVKEVRPDSHGHYLLMLNQTSP